MKSWVYGVNGIMMRNLKMCVGTATTVCVCLSACGCLDVYACECVCVWCVPQQRMHRRGNNIWQKLTNKRVNHLEVFA